MIQEQERAEKFFRAIRRDASRRRKEITQQIDAYIAAETEKAGTAAEKAPAPKKAASRKKAAGTETAPKKRAARTKKTADK